MYSIIEEIRFLEEELNALFEIKIIYSFKHLEISLKQLFGLAYPEESITKNYKWETFMQFLNSKNIEVKKMREYPGINQLRIVNNSIKHA